MDIMGDLTCIYQDAGTIPITVYISNNSGVGYGGIPIEGWDIYRINALWFEEENQIKNNEGNMTSTYHTIIAPLAIQLEDKTIYVVKRSTDIGETTPPTDKIQCVKAIGMHSRPLNTFNNWKLLC